MWFIYAYFSAVSLAPYTVMISPATVKWIEWISIESQQGQSRSSVRDA